MTQIVRLLVAELFLLSHEEGVHWVLLPVALKNTKKSPCFLRRMYELPPEALPYLLGQMKCHDIPRWVEM